MSCLLVLFKIPTLLRRCDFFKFLCRSHDLLDGAGGPPVDYIVSEYHTALLARVEWSRPHKNGRETAFNLQSPGFGTGPGSDSKLNSSGTAGSAAGISGSLQQPITAQLVPAQRSAPQASSARRLLLNYSSVPPAVDARTHQVFKRRTQQHPATTENLGTSVHRNSTCHDCADVSGTMSDHHRRLRRHRSLLDAERSPGPPSAVAGVANGAVNLLQAATSLVSKSVDAVQGRNTSGEAESVGNGLASLHRGFNSSRQARNDSAPLLSGEQLLGSLSGYESANGSISFTNVVVPLILNVHQPGSGGLCLPLLC